MLSRWLKNLKWWVLGLALLVLAVWLGVPPLVKWQIEKQATAQLGRTVTVGQVSFAPFSLELTLRDLQVAAANGAIPQLKIARLYVNAAATSLLKFAPVVDALEIDQPQLNLVHLGGGRYDVDDMWVRLKAAPEPVQPSEPQKFALYNLRLTGGSVVLADRSVGKTHTLADLSLSLPFLSNLPSQRQVTVQPQLAFTLDNSRFDSAAQAIPFSDSRKTDARLQIQPLDLRPYLAYFPADLPARLQAATLSADLRLAFEQSPQVAVKLTGTLQLGSVTLVARDGSQLASLGQLKVVLADVQPLVRKVVLASVVLEQPQVMAKRDRGGRLNLNLASQTAENTTQSIAVRAEQTGGNGKKDTEAGSGWSISVAQLAVARGSAVWADDSVGAPVRLALQDLDVQANAIAWPMTQPFQFGGQAQLVSANAAPVASSPQASSLSFSGSATDRAAQVTASMANLPLAMLAPYVATVFQPKLTGSLAAQAALQWISGSEGSPTLAVSVAQFSLDKLAVTDGKTSPVSWNKLEVAKTEIDLLRQRVALGRVALSQPALQVERGPDKQWMFERWLSIPGPPTAITSTTAAITRTAATVTVTATGAAEPWRVSLGELVVSGGSVKFKDLASPVSLDVTALQLQLKAFALPLPGTPVADTARPGALVVSAKVAQDGVNRDAGQFSFKGALASLPLAVQGEVDARRLPVHAVQAYFADLLNVELLRADASYKGRVQFAQTPAGAQLQLAGDAAVEDFRALSKAAEAMPANASTATSTTTAASTATVALESPELLSWNALSLRGLQVTLAPGTPTAVRVDETVIADFFARVILTEAGRINLADMVRTPGQPTPSLPSTPDATTSIATPAAGTASIAQNDTKTDPNAPVINMGPTSLINGRVYFSDRFIRPNYSANLSALTGKLSAFSSVAVQGSPQLAELELLGRAEGTAALAIRGQLNPLAQPLVLNINGQMSDLELPPLSTYAVKYAGHGIERGKLSMSVTYVVQPDGQLKATNRLILNQLRFGDKVEGATASLPVKLAVALLADRNGVIDLDLPISGSLNDPQFRMGPIIWKIILNLVTKAITAPFTLLASAFGGGGDELSTVAFAPGTATLTPQAAQGLDKVAKALGERPALKLTVIGQANLEVERQDYRRERLNQLLLAEQRRNVVTGQPQATAQASTALEQTPTASVPALATATLADDPALVKAVYRRADIAKPRNLVGLAKDLPVPEMQALLMANIPVTEDLMRELAVQRGVAVKDYLAAKQLPTDRLFLGAAKTAAPEPKWTPRAELSLGSQ
jgi:hypothetical protein